MRSLVLLSCALALPSCGPTLDREETLTRLRAAMEADIPDEDVLDEHNRLVLQVREADILQGMRRSEIEEALGRGQECGSRELCSRNDFRETDWVYEVGRRDGLPWGPTLIVGFDRQGMVDGVYTLTRHPGSPPR